MDQREQVTTTMSSALPYVPIIRHFRDVSEEPTDGRTRRMLRAMGGVKRTTWRNLLRPDAQEAARNVVVLAAPSGAGKSTEIARQAERLRRDGHAAFLAEAGAVATDGVRAALDAASAAALESWLPGTAPAVLFLDAVDEVYLRQRKFSDVTRRLAREIDFGTRDVQVIVTVRNGAWSGSDRSEIIEVLRARIPEPTLRMVTFEPIDEEALAALAAAEGVEDVDAFLQRFEEDELYNLLDLRPRDVRLFAQYWNKHHAFGSWTEILADFVETSFVELNPAHQVKQELSLERGLAALSRIAAASVLTRQPHITLPTSAPLPGALDGRKLFADWEPRLFGELFANGLFVHKGEAAVQLPQGALTDYLAARWFAARSRMGMSAQDLRDALFVQVFDEARWRVPVSRFPVVGWVASEVPELRKLLQDDDPRALLYEGDPMRLDLREIAAALRKVVQLATVGKGTPWATKATIRQLARPELEPIVLGLLGECRGVVEAEQHLLRYVELGHYRSCMPRAVEMTLDVRADPSIRDAAIGAIAEAGTAEDKTSLHALLDDPDVTVRSALVQALLPDGLHGDGLVRFLLGGGGHHVNYFVARVADRVNREDLDAILQALLPSLRSKTITELTKSHFELAMVLLMSWLRRAGDGPVPPWIGDIIVRLENVTDALFVSRDEQKELEALLAKRAAARRAAWLARIERATEPEVQILMSRPRLGCVQVEDLTWLFEQWESTSADVAKREIRWAIGAFYQSLPIPSRPAMREQSPALHAQVLALFDDIDGQGREFEGRQREREEGQRRENEETREKNIAALLPKKAALEQGEDWDLLCWALQQIGYADSLARVDLGRLRELVGEEMTEVFARGFRACWRRQAVPLPEPGTYDRRFVLVAGLTGLTLQIRDGFDLSALSRVEAELATRYGLHELNGFPYWFEELYAAQADAVRSVLEQVLKAEWLASREHHGTLRFASRAPRRVALVMRSILLNLLEAGPPGNTAIIRNAAETLLVSDDDAPRVATVVRSLIELPSQRDVAVQSAWLRVWLHADPGPAADWLESRRQGSPETFRALVGALGNLLDQDFDSRGRSPLVAAMDARALERWVRLLQQGDATPEEAIPRGAFSPGIWRRCLDALAMDATIEACAALRRLREDPDLASRRAELERAADAQLLRAVEAAAGRWTESDVVAVERGDSGAQAPTRTSSASSAAILHASVTSSRRTTSAIAHSSAPIRRRRRSSDGSRRA
jgi:hypothetical protein